MNPTNTQNPNNPNQYNPQTGNLVLNNSTTGIGQTPPVIPAGVGLGSVPTPSLPNTPTGTSATQLSGSSAGYMAMPALQGTRNFGSQLSNANQVANQNAQQGQQDYQSQVLGLINQMQNRPGELERQYNIQQLSADALSAKANYDSVELAYRRQKEATMTDGSISAEQKQARIGEIERKEASQKADIAIDYNLKAGLLSNAKELMQKQIALELEPMKLKVDYYKDNRDRFDKILDKTEMRQYDYIQKQEERKYQAAQKAADRIASLQMEAVKNGVSWDQAKNIKSIGDYAKLKGQTTGVPQAIAEKIGESKVGQKINANVGFLQSLAEYKNLYKKYSDEGNLISVQAQKDLAALRNDLNQKYSVANGQGAVQEGDRTSYQKIISGGVAFPEQSLKAMDTLINSLKSTAKNDVTFLDKTYQNYASQFFADQLAQTEALVNQSNKDNKISSQITTAINSGYTPDDIVKQLLTTDVASKVTQAINSGYSSQDIINYLSK